LIPQKKEGKFDSSDFGLGGLGGKEKKGVAGLNPQKTTSCPPKGKRRGGDEKKKAGA